MDFQRCTFIFLHTLKVDNLGQVLKSVKDFRLGFGAQGTLHINS